MVINKVDRNSKFPLSHQLYEILRERIQLGEWKAGDMLPPEAELIKQYQVNRITVCEVLDKLVYEGLVYRERGRGSFVAHPMIESNLVRIKSFTEDMLQRGLMPRTRVLSSEITLALGEIAEKLQVDPGTELVRLKRLRLANNESMSVEESFLVHQYCPNILTQHDYAESSIRSTLEQDHGIRLVRAQQTIRSVLATKILAQYLEISSKSPLFYIERVSYSQYNIPIEFACIFYRADRYVLYNELQG